MKIHLQYKIDKMTNNENLQKNVLEAIKWEPLLNESEISVTAKDGVVTLTGTVDNYVKKIEAESATKNVVGVKAIVEKIEIKFDDTIKRTDNEIAEEILNIFKWNLSVPDNKIQVKVECGLVTLDGELNSNYQKIAAKNSIVNLVGVIGVVNNIVIKSESHKEIEKSDIERALLRNWSLHNQNINVKVSGNRVILNGTVHSFYQKYEAGCIVWNAPGVWTVDNELEVEYNFL